MDIKRGDDIDELFSELTKAPKPEYIRLALSEYALPHTFGNYRRIPMISTSQLEYDEHRLRYFVNCAPFQPFVNDVIRAIPYGDFSQLNLALKSATTGKVAIVRICGTEVLKQRLNMTNVVSIYFELDKEHNDDVINSTGIRMKMTVLIGELEMCMLFAF